MAAIKLDKFCCHNSMCKMHGKFSVGNITNHGFYATSSGRRRRLICKICKTTFSTTKGSAYYRIQKPKQTFDSVIQTSVEGTTQSSNSRINRVSRSTVSRWLLKATNKASRTFKPDNSSISCSPKQKILSSFKMPNMFK